MPSIQVVSSARHLRRAFAQATAAAAGLALVTVAATSSADPPAARTATDPDGYTYRFNDDALSAGGLDPNDARLKVVRHAARDLLLRPRVHFIAEMLKSVENL